MKARASKALLTYARHAQYVQTDRQAHEEWGRLCQQSPRAAALAHFLVAHMDRETNAVVASWSTLARLTGMSVATARRAMRDLEMAGWVEGIRLGTGGVRAWRIDARVGWAQHRDGRRYAYFTARVIAAAAEQHPQPDSSSPPPLRRIPIIAPGEIPVPYGPGAPPPSQPHLAGLEPVVVYRAADGQIYELDERTGALEPCHMPGAGSPGGESGDSSGGESGGS
jgi:hypothetical protein